MPDTYPRILCHKVKVFGDGTVKQLKAWEEDEAGKVIKESGSPVPLSGGLDTRLRGHNSIGVLVSNPTCFIVGGTQICI